MPKPAVDSTRPSYMLAIVRTLLASGGSARPKTVYAMMEANGERRFPVLAGGVDPRLHYENAVRFARQELADGGILMRTPGIWILADAEASRALTIEDAVRLIGDNRRRRESRSEKAGAGRPGEDQQNSLILSPMEAPLRPARPTTGPKPSRYEISFRRENGPASTYLMRFSGSDIWKVGYAGDIAVRLNHVNQHVPVEVVEGGWLLFRAAPWPSQDLAYAMEQLLFQLLAQERTMFERVRCNEARILAAWDEALSATAASAARVSDVGAAGPGRGKLEAERRLDALER